jgi:competence ComEA-like helix-hairpin-helix protein
VQVTIAVIALVVSLWQLVALTHWSRRAGSNNFGEHRGGVLRWGELAGSGHPLIQIDINRAGTRELTLLPGVGPTLARRIVESRNRLGPFESVEGLARVYGIGEKTIEQIQVLGYAGEISTGRRVEEQRSVAEDQIEM